MADTVKFTDEELQKITEIQRLFNTVLKQAGQVRIEEIETLKRKQQVEDNYNEVKKMESDLVSELTTKYGQGQINLETGEFTPISTDTEEQVEESVEEVEA